MGAGKTTIGRGLARLLRWDFVDTDHALEARTGVSVSHIFEIEGEEGFRAREAKILAEIGDACNAKNQVVATGGGIILREDNRRIMRKSGTVIYLQADPELLWRRLQDCNSRPLLPNENRRDAMLQMLREREKLYAAEADFTVDAGAEPAGVMAEWIYQMLQHEWR